MSSPADSERILVLAPGGRDAALAVEAFARAGLEAMACTGFVDLCEEFERGAGAAVITEEVLRHPSRTVLEKCLATQPPWSDFPIIVLGDPDGRPRREDLYLVLGNVTILERPLRTRTLVTAAGAALRMRRRQYDARRAIRDRDQFLAMLGHELRNPLAAILFATQLSERAPGDEANARTQRAIVDRQSRRLARLVDDLLDVSRVTSGKIQLQCATLDLRETLQKSAESVASLAKSARVKVTIEPGASPTLVDADAIRLEQVFTNLLTNAIKYTPAGGRAFVTISTVDGQASVVVRDTGVGIDPAMLSRVFDLFAQIDTTLDRSQGGLGIGLTLVRSIVELHGGRVSASSRGPGTGAEFTVLLPLAAAGAAPRAAESSPARLSISRRVVLVEDNDDIREGLQMLIEQSGHSVETARDGLQGVELIVRTQPDVAFVDIGLPGIDGFEIARRVRAAGGARHVFLVALTGYGQPEDRARALAAGFDEHLTKPTSAEAIDEILRSRASASA